MSSALRWEIYGQACHVLGAGIKRGLTDGELLNVVEALRATIVLRIERDARPPVPNQDAPAPPPATPTAV